MGKTALDLTCDEWQAYQPGAELDREQLSERWRRAWNTARLAAQVLRRRFGATRIVAFGSLTRRDWFTPWSDIDLAAWDMPPDVFYRAVAAVTGLDPEFKVDLVVPEDCQPTLRRVIEQEGVAL
jgi:predicted nucleotidyltransferase